MTEPPTDLREVGYRLDDVDRWLGRIETIMSTKADGAAMAREIELIRADLKHMREATDAAILRADTTANEVIRSGRSETLKLIVAAMTAFAVLFGGVVIAYASGRI